MRLPVNERSQDTGQGDRMVENEPLTKEILRQISVLHTKMDSVGKALETLARVEERQAATKEAMDRHWKATTENTQSIAQLAATVTEVRRETTNRLELHLLWAVTAGAVGVCGYLLKLALGV